MGATLVSDIANLVKREVFKYTYNSRIQSTTYSNMMNKRNAIKAFNSAFSSPARVILQGFGLAIYCSK